MVIWLAVIFVALGLIASGVLLGQKTGIWELKWALGILGTGIYIAFLRFAHSHS